MVFRFNKLVSYWQPALACIGALVVAVATLNEAEHSRWNLLGAVLVAAGALAMAIDQVRSENKIAALITGGNSFVYFEFIRRRDHPERQYFILACHQGGETVRDLSATVANVSLLIKKPPNELPQVEPAMRIGNVVPGSRNVVSEIIFPAEEVRFQVSFEAANGMWMQTVIGIPTDSAHTFAVQVWKIDFGTPIPTRRTLFENVDSSFPRGKDGSIDWSFGSVVLDRTTSKV